MKMLLLIIPLVLMSSAYASTISQYCSSGTCVTPAITPIPVNYTFGVRHLPILFISYSEVCKTMFENHISGCQTLGSFITRDTSNQNISGHFTGNEEIRSAPQVKNHWMYYTNQTICVECSADINTLAQSQQIILAPEDFTFIDQNNNNATTNWLSYHSRYMQGCDIATIGNIPGLLNDTISYMLHGCTNTNFNGTTTNQLKSSAWDYNNPFSSLHQITYLKSILNGHTYNNGNKTNGGNGLQDCIRHMCNFTDPYKKAGW